MSTPQPERRYRVVDFAEIPGVPCPCGTARLAFADVPDIPATVHVTEISEDAALHYHKRLTETYFFLECNAGAEMQLDNDILPVKPGMSITIPPGVRRRAIGRMKALINATPKFDPWDEWLASERPNQKRNFKLTCNLARLVRQHRIQRRNDRYRRARRPVYRCGLHRPSFEGTGNRRSSTRGIGIVRPLIKRNRAAA